jgi:putative transposase
MEQKRAYRYRFYPTPEQAAGLAQTFGRARYVYNWALRVRTDAYYQRQERLGYHEASAALTTVGQRSEMAWPNEVSRVPPRQGLRHLEKAFRTFEGRAKYPRFRTYPIFRMKHGRQAATYASSAFRWDAETHTLILAKMDAPLDIHGSRSFTGTPTTVTISKGAAGRYLVSFLVEEDVEAPPVVNATIGVAVGLKDRAALSTGEKIATPQYLRRSARHLAQAQRALARKQKGSRNREKARLKAARVYAKMTDRRPDSPQQLTACLIPANQTVWAESLAVKHLVRNPPVAQAISDVGWGGLVRLLEYKANWYGRALAKTDQWYPSPKRCHACGYALDALPLDMRRWPRPDCDVRNDRDSNAAKNSLAVGPTVNACGEAVSPGRAMPNPARPGEAGFPRL